MGKSGGVCLSPHFPTQPGSFQAHGSRLSQNDSDRPRVAVVQGPGQSIESGSFQSSTGKGSGDTAIQRSSPQQSEPSCLAPRASSIQEQGFSDEVAARIEAPQRSSTRAVYKLKWAVLLNGVSQTRWTSGRPL